MNIFEIFAKLNTQEKCLKYLELKRWGRGKVTCPYCNSDRTCKHLHRHQCWNCNKSFSVTIGTIFHNTHIDLQKWFLVIAMMLNARKSLSACQIARDLDMRRPTVWSMMHRIRKAMKQDKDFLQGIVEVDETYIGGKPRANEHKKRNKDDDNDFGGGSKKSVIFGMIERNGKVKAMKVDNAKRNTLTPHILENIKKDSSIISDENKVYHYLYVNYKHETVNHSKLEFVRGKAHTNSIEGFWSLLKRGIKGQFHHISKKYTNSYVDEFCWRYNNKENRSIFEKLVGNMLVI